MIGLGIRRQDGETWIAAALRLATPRDLQRQVMEHYEFLRSLQMSEEEAALAAARDVGVVEMLGADE